MNRTPIDSSNLHSVAAGDTFLEVQFHRAGCARGTKPATVQGETRQAACNCPGGDVWRYPMEAELAMTHYIRLQAPGAGAYFHRYIKSAKNAAGQLLFPGVKRDETPA